ncbi:hypothetical protein CWS72_26950 [Telmatospirillum siberiense]|uniref:Uncharacterized protein n=1 Tax=Telmatospirillum siberiense TaxID=382514 RepID=A0A2N3PLV9_9PROT|nr:hypothetical protein CWS72_26950 [Telmatospirillum siberiense]
MGFESDYFVPKPVSGFIPRCRSRKAVNDEWAVQRCRHVTLGRGIIYTPNRTLPRYKKPICHH